MLDAVASSARVSVRSGRLFDGWILRARGAAIRSIGVCIKFFAFLARENVLVMRGFRGLLK